MHKKMIVVTILVFLLTACLPGQSQPDIDARVNTAVAETQQAENRIAESVAQTVTAQERSAATSTATSVPEITATFERVKIITDTPFPPLPPLFDTDTPVPPVTPQLYSCFVLTITPDRGQEIKAGASFEIRWNVKNTGTRPWDAGVDLKYAGGAKMTNAERVEIPKSLAPGESYKISLTGKAPKTKGIQQMTWIVEGQLCYAVVVITVK